MDLLWDENRPDTCLSLGLDCRTCVQRSASTVATLSPGLSGAAAQQIFTQIFPAPGCAPMAIAFAHSYLEADGATRQSPVLSIVAAA